ncbi:MAG: hypothetical protein Kow00108_14050 [Calditrichia bacterium]
MIIIKSLYRWIFGLTYIGIFLTLVFLLTFICKRPTVERILKVGIKGLFRLLWIRVDVEETVPIDWSTTYIIMANHVSLFDVPLLAGYIPQIFTGIAAYHQFNWPIYGWVLSRLQHIPMIRENPVAAKRSYETAVNVLKSGTSIALMPEGHRTLTGEMNPFKRFPFHIAKKANVPILPVGLSGLYTLKSKKSWLIPGDRIKLKIGKPVSPEKYQTLSESELAHKIKETIQSLIEYK